MSMSEGGREGEGGRVKLTKTMLLVHEYNTPGSLPGTHMHQLQKLTW